MILAYYFELLNLPVGIIEYKHDAILKTKKTPTLNFAAVAFFVK